MIESITPQLIASSMAFILLSALFLTAVLSVGSLWLYHRSVARHMSLLSSHPQQPPELSAHYPPWATLECANHPDRLQCNELYLRASKAVHRDGLLYMIAVLAPILPLSLVAQTVYPSGLGLPGVLIGCWLYGWPVVPLLILILPASRARSITFVSCYLLGYLGLSVWAGTIANVPALHLGALHLPARSGVTPMRMAILWAAANAIPTLLCLLCYNRRVRAVAPLLLALTTILMTGLCALWLWLAAETEGWSWWQAVSTSLTHWLQWLAFLLVVVGLPLLSGSLALRWIARGYRDKATSDRSLRLDSIYLAFLANYGFWLVLGGMVWLVCLPLAFLAYKLVLLTGRQVKGPEHAPRGLCFLRVFALGQRSEKLREAVARYWRQIGPLQMITGPDVATGTVQPHHFLDFLSGRLGSHFIKDPASLTLALAQLDYAPDPDGRFRINSLFCYQDTWQSVLPALVQRGETVMMDLRGFSRENSGCQEELTFLAERVPFTQCLVVVDLDTDRDLLWQSLTRTLASVPAESPNAGASPRQLRNFEFTGAGADTDKLVRALCALG